MAFRIADNFSHHPYTRMAKAFMPNFKCVNILKNYLVRNMWYGFDVCVVQFGRKRGNFFNNSFVISAIFSNKENFLTLLGKCSSMTLPFRHGRLQNRRQSSSMTNLWRKQIRHGMSVIDQQLWRNVLFRHWMDIIQWRRVFVTDVPRFLS